MDEVSPTAVPGHLGDLPVIKEGARRFLQAMHVEGVEYRFCAANEPWLIGSCLAAMLGKLVGDVDTLPASEREAWVAAINTRQREDGWYDDADIRPPNLRPGYERDRALLHRTRHALLAFYGLGGRPQYPLTFAEQWLEPGRMRRWCEYRSLADYWYASNMMMDAAIFLLDYADSTGDERGRQAVHELLDFCDDHIDPETGYHDAGRSERRNAMAGAMHLYPVYVLLGREIRHVPAIVEATLGLQQPDGLFGYESGTGGEDCLDYDAVLILANMHALSGSADQSRIEDAFARCLDGIMINRNDDGGFACHRRDETYYFGTWTTAVPPGVSSLWATYSRLVTIAMMGNVLDPPSHDLWTLKTHLMEIWDAQP